MTDGQAAVMLNIVKVDLGITGTDYDARLTALLSVAERAITEMGATLDLMDPGDVHLVTQYAEWQFRRRDEMPGMPRMLQYAINNRVFGEKMREGTP